MGLGTVCINDRSRVKVKVPGRQNKGDRYTPREDEGLKAPCAYPSFCSSAWSGGGVERYPGLDDL